MIRAIIFDLDGVLADTTKIHFDSLLWAISTHLPVGIEEAMKLVTDDGTTTKHKLIKLQKQLSLTDEVVKLIDTLKQDKTKENLVGISTNDEVIHTIRELKIRNCKLAVASNARAENVEIILNTLGIKDQFVEILSNESVSKPKPDPEIFLEVMRRIGVQPYETLILEDSESGIAAANASKAFVLKINSCDETNLENILNAIQKANYCRADGGNGFQIF